MRSSSYTKNTFHSSLNNADEFLKISNPSIRGGNLSSSSLLRDSLMEVKDQNNYNDGKINYQTSSKMQQNSSKNNNIQQQNYNSMNGYQQNYSKNNNIKQYQSNTSNRDGNQQYMMKKYDSKRDKQYRGSSIQAQDGQNQPLNQCDVNFENGDTYVGSFSNAQFEGYGVYTFRNDNLQYRGQFKRNKMEGIGTLLDISRNKPEQIYDGDWSNSMKHGFGNFKYANGISYRGGWEKNMKHGKGSYIAAEGTYQGSWMNDQYHGNGILKIKNGQNYDGQWAHGNFLQGTIKYPNGDVYFGDFKEGQRHGYGEYYYNATKATYKGQWQGNKKHGKGEMWYANGDAYIGNLNQDQKEGPQSTYLWSNEYKVTGKFINDIPVSGIMTEPGKVPFEFEIQ